MPAVKPELLVWARETAGLTIAAAAAKIGLEDRKAVTAAERLAAMESGLEETSRSVLLEMARAYHRPLIAFYLSRPPAKGKRGADFRSLPALKMPGTRCFWMLSCETSTHDSPWSAFS